MIYIHIPYCEHKCPYCAFNSFAGSFDENSYIDALIRQFEADKKEFGFERFGSLYIGGGTPSLISSKAYAKLFRKIVNFLEIDSEITIEANPNSANQKWLEEMKNLGVNRVSFGVQSFDKNKLKILGRIHSADQAITAIQKAKSLGLETNIDLIYGMKCDTKELLENDINLAKTSGATHISAYMLTLEDDTPFSDKNHLISDDLIGWFASKIESYGYPRYEVAAFGKIRSKHNLGYWQKKNYLGIGAGAVGTADQIRYSPHKNPDRYINDPFYKDIETLSDRDIKAETIMLGLRSCVGFDENLIDQKIKKVLLDERKIYIEDGFAKATDLFVADEIALYLFG